MKKIYIIVFIFLSITRLNAQFFSLKLLAIDALNNKDSVYFGLNDTSSLGIDTAFGEINIIGQPLNVMDLRVVQRDSLNYECLQIPFWIGPGQIYSIYNIDSKKDFRPSFLNGDFNNIYGNFEIKIMSSNYPVTIKADFSEIFFSPYEGWSTIHLMDDNCESVNYQNITSWQDTLFVITDSTQKTLIANFQHEVGLNENKAENSIDVFPNPVNDILSITKANDQIESISVLSIDGKYLLKEEKDVSSIDCSKLKPGIYLIQITSEKGYVFRKIIKN